MSYFSESFNKKEKLVPRTFEIDDNLYKELEKLSKFKYDASINKMVNLSIEKLSESNKIIPYEVGEKIYIHKGFLLRESVLKKLYDMKAKYKIPTYILVNIAIREGLEKYKEG